MKEGDLVRWESKDGKYLVQGKVTNLDGDDAHLELNEYPAEVEGWVPLCECILIEAGPKPCCDKSSYEYDWDAGKLSTCSNCGKEKEE